MARICPICRTLLIRRGGERQTDWERRVYCSPVCARIGRSRQHEVVMGGQRATD